MSIFSRSYILTLGAMLLFSAMVAQDLKKDYVPLRSQGKLPEDFIISASSKADQEIQQLEKRSDDAAKEKMKFIVSSTFFLDNVLKSGKVLYGDPLSLYVNKVAKEIMKSDPELEGKVRVYVVKSSVVNAYTFDNGVVLVNTGLLSQLETESQLAFVLCHEFTHYLKKHEITAYIDFIKMENNKKSYNRNGTDLLLEKSKYSQKQELEADGEGFELYNKTKYSYKSIDGLFDVLQYSYLPFDSVAFDKNFFNDKSLIIPNSYFLEKVKDIKADENYSDSLSTHPNIAKRRAQIVAKIGDKKDIDRPDFIISETEFKKARDLSRFETCRLYMLDLDYCDAIYSSFSLMKQYPENIYLKKIVARSLYEVATYKSLYEHFSYSVNYKNYTPEYFKKKEKSVVEEQIDYVDSIQGSSQQVFYLMHKMNAQELTILALHNNWKLNQYQNYADIYTNEICDSLIHILTEKDSVILEDFSAELPKPKVEEVGPKDSVTEGTEKEQSSYDKIKRNIALKLGAEKIAKNDFSRFAFVEIMNDPKFVDKYKKFQSDMKGNKKNSSEHDLYMKNGEFVDAPDSVRIDEEKMKVAHEEEEKTFADLYEFKTLGIDKVVIVDPFYMKLDMRKKDNVSYYSGEKKQKDFYKLLKQNAGRLQLNYEILDPNSFVSDGIEGYNDLSVLNDWFEERLAHGDFQNPIVLNSEVKQDLIKKFGTKYMMWTGAISTHEKKTRLGLNIIGCFIPYTLPICLNYVIFPKYDTYFYSILFDIETGEIILLNEHAIEMKDRKDVLNSVIYDTFYQVKTPLKKNKIYSDH